MDSVVVSQAPLDDTIGSDILIYEQNNELYSMVVPRGIEINNQNIEQFI